VSSRLLSRGNANHTRKYRKSANCRVPVVGQRKTSVAQVRKRENLYAHTHILRLLAGNESRYVRSHHPTILTGGPPPATKETTYTTSCLTNHCKKQDVHCQRRPGPARLLRPAPHYAQPGTYITQLDTSHACAPSSDEHFTRRTSNQRPAGAQGSAPPDASAGPLLCFCNWSWHTRCGLFWPKQFFFCKTMRTGVG
jgi:hypothetical protein